MTSAAESATTTATAAASATQPPSAPVGTAAPALPPPLTTPPTAAAGEQPAPADAAAASCRVDPIAAVQDSIDGLALALFEALRGVRDAVAPESLAAPGTRSASTGDAGGRAAMAFLPADAGDDDEDEKAKKDVTAAERLLRGVNPAYFPPRAFDALEPDYDAFLMAHVAGDTHARALAARFASLLPKGAAPAAAPAADAAPAAPTKVVKVGDVGYEFRKQFDAGWFTGKVTEIRPGAANGYDRRCVFADGDIEDLRVKDLQLLAKLDPERKAPRPPGNSVAAPPADDPRRAPAGAPNTAIPLTAAEYATLLHDAEQDRDADTTRRLARDVVAKSRAVDDLVARLPGMGRTRQAQLARIEALIDANHAAARRLAAAHRTARERREEVRARLGERTCAALGVEEETR